MDKESRVVLRREHSLASVGVLALLGLSVSACTERLDGFDAGAAVPDLSAVLARVEPLDSPAGGPLLARAEAPATTFAAASGEAPPSGTAFIGPPAAAWEDTPYVPAPPATAPRGVVALQTARTEEALSAVGAGGEAVPVTLTNLAPRVGAWYLLEIAKPSALVRGLSRGRFHLEARPTVRLHLDAAYPQGLVVESGSRRVPCPLWGSEEAPLAGAAASRDAFVSLCGGDVTLRNTASGNRTKTEWVTEFLRDRVPGGEQLTNFVKEQLMEDAFLRTAELAGEAAPPPDQPPGAPLAAKLAAEALDRGFVPLSLGLAARTEDPEHRLLVGRWYALEEQPGVFVSGVEARHIAPEIATAQARVTGGLDGVESRALDYLVAFDLGRYDLAYALGTEHPRVDWSERAPSNVRDERAPGPDGFSSVEPLVRSGRVGPFEAPDVVAAFAGGFKRSHGAFKYGPMANVNRGTHYGFIEEGVVLSSLQPGLATAVVWDDGRVELMTWTREDDARVGRIRYARQNGVPILETEHATGEVRVGERVLQWGAGNWSGSQDKRFRTLRAGLCLQESAAGRFLIYGYFSSVTPAAMARVFGGYGCGYAMLLDMNALEHTYLAVYGSEDGRRVVHHLERGMSVVDKKSSDGTVLPRFIAAPDNRDFFYLKRKVP